MSAATNGDALLVVDDNVTNMKLVLALLASERYTVYTAVDAHEAFAALENVVPRVILLDLQLPDMDGLTLARRLRNDPRTKDVVIVAVTAYAMRGDEEKARQAGVDAYVTKPIEKASFRALVRRYMQQRSQGRT